MLKWILFLYLVAAIMTSRADNPKSKQISDAKADIVNLAQTFSGRGDPDFSKQESLEPLIKRLLELPVRSSNVF